MLAVVQEISAEGLLQPAEMLDCQNENDDCEFNIYRILTKISSLELLQN